MPCWLMRCTKNSYKIIQGFEADLREYFLKTNHSGNAPGFCRWKSICVRANFFTERQKRSHSCCASRHFPKKCLKCCRFYLYGGFHQTWHSSSRLGDCHSRFAPSQRQQLGRDFLHTFSAPFPKSQKKWSKSGDIIR